MSQSEMIQELCEPMISVTQEINVLASTLLTPG